MKEKIVFRIVNPITLTFILFGFTTFSVAGEISGYVSSVEGKPLTGVNIVVRGTSYGAATDVSGYYRISDIEDDTYVITASRIGYFSDTRKVHLTGAAQMDFILTESVIRLSEVTVTGTFATEMKTPITFSTFQEKEILSQYTVQDIPQVLRNIPAVYVTTDGGSGLGDSRIMIRGFDEKRIQVLVNNIPVNDPESKKIFWSNWSMLPGVAQTIQIQRGVGTSLYGSGALGGSINIITKDAPPVKSGRLVGSFGQYGIKKIGLAYNSGFLNGNVAFTASINFLEGNGWRENTFFRGLQYYVSASLFPNPKNILKFIVYGAPQYHTLSNYSFDPAAYGNNQQISDESQIDGGKGNKNQYGEYAYGFGRLFNGNVHMPKDELPAHERKRFTALWDALFLRGKIGASPERQVGGWIIAGDRASMDNNVSHRPQLEIHHAWQITEIAKLTSTFFVTKGLDYTDNVFPFYYIPRDQTGSFQYDTINEGNYYGGDQVFQYRFYSDFFQTGFLSAWETNYRQHHFSAGIEFRYWKSRHAGEMLNTFGRKQVEVKVGSVEHTFKSGDLFYDFDTEKPQITLFGRALWHLGKLDIMTNFQVSEMKYHVLERVPSNNNYPNHLDAPAVASHGGNLWTGNATWDHDDDLTTPEKLVEYTLWDYYRSYRYFTPRLGINYNINGQFNLFANWSVGVKEPRVKHFFGYGSPRRDIELERTDDIELGLRFNGRLMDFPLSLQLNWYNIQFAGKLMEITVPEKANTPGYDYAGHYYVPIGEATYKGTELELSTNLPLGFRLGLNLSKSSNTWGEPNGSEGAQKLYANVALAGADYLDANNNGVWDEGGQEFSLHRNFVKKYAPRFEVGMPQLIIGTILTWKNGPLSISSAARYYKDLYVMEDNSKVRLGPGMDNIFGTEDDEFSATIIPATILDMNVNYSLTTWGRKLNFALHVNNVLNTLYWQRGDEYGLSLGPARTIIFSTKLEM